MSFNSSASSGRSFDSTKMDSANLLVKGFPPTIKESELQQVFLHYGTNTCRLVSGLAFVCFSSIADAYNAITALDGVQTPSGVLQLIPIPAISDAALGEGEPGASDNLYVLHIPAHWTETELVELFSPYGPVRQCRIFQVLNRSNCGSALVRMNNLASARKAIQAINGRYPVRRPGESQQMPLVVRYADSPEEKARKKQRKEQLANLQQRILLEGPYTGTHMPLERQLAEELLQQAVGNLKLGGSSPPGAHMDFAADPMGSAPLSAYPYASSPLNAGSQSIWAPRTSLELLGPPASPPKTLNPAPGAPLSRLGPTPGPAVNPYPRPESPTSVYVSNAPRDADNLWVYKRFAPHGPILDVDFHREAGTGECVCSVKYMNRQSAVNAIQNINAGGKDPLHVTLQPPSREGL